MPGIICGLALPVMNDMVNVSLDTTDLMRGVEAGVIEAGIAGEIHV